jgi:hypothetical protein
MTLEDIVHQVESRLLGLGRLFWRPDPMAKVYDALDRNEVQAQTRRRELATAEGELASLRRRIDDRRAAADLLLAQIESARTKGESDRAWRLALDLDRLRQELSDDQKHLGRAEQVTWSLGFAVRQLERERTRLEARAKT